MTKKLLQIVPYIATHGKIILANQMNHVLMDKEKALKMLLKASQLKEEDIQSSKTTSEREYWNGVAEGWVLATAKVWNHPLVIARAIKKNFARLAKENNIKRVQTAVRADFTIGLKFASWLGLQNEGLMKHYGFDGSDHFRYARIF